jgi:hypothetical protein
MHGTAGFNTLLDKRQEAFSRGIGDSMHSDATYLLSIFLRSNNNHRFPLGFSALDAFLQAANEDFVHLHTPAQTVASWPNHCAPEFMQQMPRGSVTQPQKTLQAQGTSPVLLSDDPPHGAKPSSQWQVRVLENSSSQNPSLPATRGTFKDQANLPELFSITMCASYTVRPTHIDQEIEADGLRTKESFKFWHGSGKVFHAINHYQLGLPVSSIYPYQKFW